MPKEDLVLLAIGEEEIQSLFGRALMAAGYRAAVVAERESLERVLQESTPALIILGRKYGDLDGVVVASDLLERFPTLPVILYADKEDPVLVRQALRIGISDCLFAPLKINEIVKTAENSVQRASRLGDWVRREVKRSTAALRKRVDELQKLDAIMNHIDDGVIILDESLQILLLNAAVRRAFGLWKEDDFTGKPLLEVLTHPDMRALVNDQARKPSARHEILFEDGRAFSAQYSPIPGIGAAITMQDISFFKHIDRLKNEFVSTVSHDLRSPLTAILGYVELLERVGQVNDQQREFIRRVQLSVQNITCLVDDLLELGRIEAGLDEQKEPIPMEGIIRLSLEDLADKIKEKELQLDLSLADNILSLRGNPIRLRQLFDNLIGNAIKYSPVGGRIRVEAEMQTDQVILRVEDSGPGIPPADQPHVFEKFYRASNVPQGVAGTGLGLAIVKSIVDNHGGRIWVDSVLGHGSTFTVVLPLGEKKA